VLKTATKSRSVREVNVGCKDCAKSKRERQREIESERETVGRIEQVGAYKQKAKWRNGNYKYLYQHPNNKEI